MGRKGPGIVAALAIATVGTGGALKDNSEFRAWVDDCAPGLVDLAAESDLVADTGVLIDRGVTYAQNIDVPDVGEVQEALRDVGNRAIDAFSVDSVVEFELDTSEDIVNDLMNAVDTQLVTQDFDNVLEGIRVLNEHLDLAYESLESVPSRAVRGQSVAESIPRDVIVRILLVENTSHVDINPANTTNRIARVMLQIAEEREGFKSGTESSAGAIGAMQIMSDNLESVPNLYALDGMDYRQLSDSFILAACLVDDILKSHLYNNRPSEWRDIAISYNTSYYRHSRYMRGVIDSLPEEAILYGDKFDAIDEAMSR